MSYLLTEIALEMLGYKFYDIYGMQDEINNFQKQTNTERSTNESNGNETNLAQLLGINTEGDRNRKTNSANKELLEEVNANLPDSLNKLMDNEYNRVRQQVLHKKPTLMVDTNQNAQAIIQNFIETEHEKLRFEHQSLRNFRKIVEQNLLQVNPATFEKYCQTFKPARKQLKRLEGSKK